MLDIVELLRDHRLTTLDDLLERELRIGLLEKPSPREYRSLVNYIYNNKPVIQDEVQFLKHRDDFVQLTEKTDSPLESLLVWIICRIPIRWVRVCNFSPSYVFVPRLLSLDSDNLHQSPR